MIMVVSGYRYFDVLNLLVRSFFSELKKLPKNPRNVGLVMVFAIYLIDPETITPLLTLYFQVPAGSDRSTIK